MIIVFHDAPEGNKELKEGLISDAQRLYLRAVGEPRFESRLIKQKGSSLWTILVFVVEVWRFELQASSSRRDVCMFFAHNYLHIVRIFRQNDPYLTNASAISVQKNSVDGQRCGRSLFLPQNRETRNTPTLIKSVVPFLRFYCSIVL